MRLSVVSKTGDNNQENWILSYYYIPREAYLEPSRASTMERFYGNS